jgi:hypothetical protein
MRTKRTRAYKAAQAMLRDPYYLLLRNTDYGFGYGATRAYKAVKEYDALTKGITITHGKKKRCKETA